MQDEKQQVKTLIKQFHESYYAREYDVILSMLTSDFALSGALVDGVVDGKRLIQEMIRLIETKRVHTSLQNLHMDVEEKNANSWIVDAVYEVKRENEKSLTLSTSFLVVKDTKLKIRKIFISLAQPNCPTQYRVDYLENFVLEKEKIFHEDELTKDVPGGILKCMYNEELTLIDMSDGFLQICGYTREELKANFNNSLRALIVEDDFKKTIVEVEKQLKISSTKRIEYRIRHKNGDEIWLLDKGRLVTSETYGQCFHCIVIDISVEKEIQDAYQELMERNQIIMNQNDDVVFEWDLEKDLIFVSNNWGYKTGEKGWEEGISAKDISSNHAAFPIYKDDLIIAETMMDEVKNGVAYLERELRVCRYDERPIWCRIRVTTKFDKNGKPCKAIGIIIDIDMDKKESISLLKKASQDGLTGMNNKMVTQELIQKELVENQGVLGALLLVDIDDFKFVNDSMGHLYGDAVLKDIAEALRANTRSSDIIGRIGGDEFMLYLKDVKTEGYAKEKAQKIVNSINSLTSLRELPKQISCSIGISIYPTHCEDFTTLYQYCDYALYQAKTEGKNRYEVYNDTKIQDYLKCKVNSYASLINAGIDTNDENAWVNDIAHYVFEVLYHSDNEKEAIEKIIEIIGDKYNVSRVYIFENEDGDESCSNTFEWCNHGINAQKHLLQKVTYSELGGNYLNNFDEKGIFYCSDINCLPKEQYDILEPQGIKSLLQCAIMDKGKFRGFIGFDECNANCYWTQDQINVLILISEILSIFLLKSRKEEQYKAENEVLLSILDHQNAYIYIIDANTYELLYINEKTKEAVPDALLRQQCYHAFIGAQSPCNNCPAKLVGKHNSNATLEFHNEKLGLWTDADASYIKWQKKDAILLVCHDIGRFKEKSNK